MSAQDIENGIFESYEVKIFNRINVELLLIEKTIEISIQNLNEAGKASYYKEKAPLIWSNVNEIVANEKKELEKNISKNDSKYFNDFLYIVVSFVDEFFIRKGSTIAEFWNKNLLETSYFNSRNSGTIFYEKIDAILQNHSDYKKSIIFVYLLALSLGFKGRFYGGENEDEILNYKRALYGLSFTQNLYSPSGDYSAMLSNHSEQNNLDDYPRIELANNKRYFQISLFIIFIYIFSSYAYFNSKKTDIEHKLSLLNKTLEFIER